MIPAILVVEPEVAFQVLPLNTEKAHNLKEKSLEVIRMYRGLAEQQPASTEDDWALQFESPHFITLGLLYEQNKRFAGGAFAPILRRVDKFLKGSLRKGLEERAERAELVRAADETLAQVVAKVKKRGINHPYVKNYLLARTTPLTRARKTLPSFEQTFKKLREQPRRLRRDQGPLRRDPALGHHAGAGRGGVAPCPGWRSSPAAAGALGQAITHRCLADGAVVCVPWVVEQERERLEASVPAGRPPAPDARGALRRQRRRRHGRPGGAHGRSATAAIDALVTAVGGFAMRRPAGDRSRHLGGPDAGAQPHQRVRRRPRGDPGHAGRRLRPRRGRRLARGWCRRPAASSPTPWPRPASSRSCRRWPRKMREHGITVNAVAPSTMDTPGNRAAMPDSDRKGWVPVECRRRRDRVAGRRGSPRT